jgi:hypothetical protein
MAQGRYNPRMMALKMNFILEAFAQADTLDEVCFAAGISHSTLRRWRQNDTDFDDRCIAAADVGIINDYEV